MISRLIINLRRPRDDWENPATRSKTKANDATQFMSNAVDMLGMSVADDQDGAVASRERFVRETIQQHSRSQPVTTVGSVTVGKEERFTTEIIEMQTRSRPTTADSAVSSRRALIGRR